MQGFLTRAESRALRMTLGRRVRVRVLKSNEQPSFSLLFMEKPLGLKYNAQPPRYLVIQRSIIQPRLMRGCHYATWNPLHGAIT